MKRFLNSKLSKGKDQAEAHSPPPDPTETGSPPDQPPYGAMERPFANGSSNSNGAGFNPPDSVQLPPPPRVTDVGAAIGWSCAMPVFDSAYLLQLAEYCGTSSVVSKQASKALRAELAHGSSQAQERAVRLLLVLMRNCDHRFREHVASKKFIALLQDLYASKKTDERTRASLVRVLSALAYDYQRDADLSPLTALYNRIKPPTAPVNGEPLAPDDPLLALSSVPYRRQSNHQASHRPAPHRIPTDAHSLAQVRALARETQGAASLLHEAVAFAAPEADLARDELLQEFIAKASTGVADLGDQKAWVLSLAERKRNERRERDELKAAEAASRADAEAVRGGRAGSGDHAALASNNPYKRMFEGSPPVEADQGHHDTLGEAEIDAERETDEERTLGLVLSAYEAGEEAMKLYHAHQDRRHEAIELKEAEERSRLETRFDRSTAGTPDAQGAYHPASQAGPGEGTSASTNPYAAHMSPARAKRLSTDDSLHKLAPSSQARPGASLIDFDNQPDYTESPLASPTDETGRNGIEDAYGGLAELGLGTPPRSARQASGAGSIGSGSGSGSGAGASSSPRGWRAERSATVGSEVLQDPTEPSSKALGKLRRVSVREDSETDAEEKMRELEAKLRAKYERSAEAASAGGAAGGCE